MSLEYHLLLVEDNDGDARLFREMLRDLGHDGESIERVGTVEDCLTALEAASFDALFLDLDLPDGRGLDTLERVMSHGHDVPIVVLTGLSDAELGTDAVERGAQDYLVKGEFHADVLARVVRYAKGRHQAVAVAKRETARAAAAEMRLRTLEEGRAALEHEVAERRLAQSELERSLTRLQAFRSIDRAIIANYALQPMLNVVLHEGVTLLRADAGTILLLGGDDRRLTCAAEYGGALLREVGGAVTLDDSPFPAALRDGAATVDLLHPAGGLPPRIAAMRDAGMRGYHAVPLLARDQLLGVLELFYGDDAARGADWLDDADTVAAQAAVAIDGVRLQQSLLQANDDLTSAYDATIDGWSRALDLRDRETEGHSRRVTELTLRLAREFGIADDDLAHMRRGALLHDIGKMGVPDAILQKPGALDEDEWAVMRRHPTLARDLLEPIPYLRPALDIPYCHHERWDGSGYPQGLAGRAIPVAARIFAVVDVYDALTSDRPYRRAWSHERALAYVRDQAGAYFDPTIVQVFVSLQAAAAPAVQRRGGAA